METKCISSEQPSRRSESHSSPCSTRLPGMWEHSYIQVQSECVGQLRRRTGDARAAPASCAKSFLHPRTRRELSETGRQRQQNHLRDGERSPGQEEHRRTHTHIHTEASGISRALVKMCARGERREERREGGRGERQQPARKQDGEWLCKWAAFSERITGAGVQCRGRGCLGRKAGIEAVSLQH